MDNKYSDHELSILIKQGDESAYLQLYDKYKVILHKHAYSKLGNLDDADDVIQDLFIHLWEKRGAIEFTSNVSGYLYTAVRNRVFNHFQLKKRQAVYLDSLVGFMQSGDNLTDKALREKELVTLIEQEVNALPPRMREVFNLSRIEGRSHKEISTQLGTSEQTVSKQITNVLKILRNKLQQILMQVMSLSIIINILKSFF